MPQSVPGIVADVSENLDVAEELQEQCREEKKERNRFRMPRRPVVRCEKEKADGNESAENLEAHRTDHKKDGQEGKGRCGNEEVGHGPNGRADDDQPHKELVHGRSSFQLSWHKNITPAKFCK